MTQEEKIKQLEAENKKLRDTFKSQKESKRKRRKIGWSFLKRSSGMVLGVKLKTSIEDFLNELGDDRRVSRETLSNLLSAVVLRLTRVGFLLVLTAILPSILLIFQTYYLAKQTTLIDDQKTLFQNQNVRLDQQTYLQEAERRGNVIILLDNMIKDVNDEIDKTPLNSISKPTTGRLIALSKMLKPYRYLKNDSLTERILSPERGYLLLSLIESDLSLKLGANSSLNGSLLERLDFSYAELVGVSIINEDLLNINLSYADLSNSNFSGNDFEKAEFKYADLNNTVLDLANLKATNFEGAILSHTSFKRADLTSANLSLADLRGADFSVKTLKGAILTNARVSENFEVTISKQLNKEDYAWFTKTYKVVEVDDENYQILKK
jgi:hypothetical protein